MARLLLPRLGQRRIDAGSVPKFLALFVVQHFFVDFVSEFVLLHFRFLGKEQICTLTF